MPELSDIGYIKEILSRHGFHFSKSLGQNFITDHSLCPKMAEESVINGEYCALEIGPGIGVLTKALAKRAKKVVAVELDSALPPILKETLADCDNVEIVEGDALKMDLEALAKEKFGSAPFVVAANLPYYITSPMLMKLLESKLSAESITVMVQKEAAERITAQMGTRLCGAITAAIHYYSTPKKLFDVPRGAFMPMPKVDSAVIKLTVRNTPPVNVKSEKLFFKLIKASFLQRRKTLANSLSAGLGMDKETVITAIEKAGLPKTARAEELSLENYATLTDLLL